MMRITFLSHVWAFNYCFFFSLYHIVKKTKSNVIINNYLLIMYPIQCPFIWFNVICTWCVHTSKIIVFLSYNTYWKEKKQKNKWKIVRHKCCKIEYCMNFNQAKIRCVYCMFFTCLYVLSGSSCCLKSGNNWWGREHMIACKFFYLRVYWTVESTKCAYYL